ncbi:MAG: hypothetical protein V2A78_14040 [bacterium]
MARALRIQYEGAFYHVTCRGNERREIFKDDHDRQKFLRILKDSLDTYQAQQGVKSSSLTIRRR